MYKMYLLNLNLNNTNQINKFGVGGGWGGGGGVHNAASPLLVCWFTLAALLLPFRPEFFY